ncbi:MAG: IMP cyclohydrolase [Spirochaetaceae bacterium]|nr:IMP cyclohydrolase [Spirochaetaceae bacterium]
MSSNDIKKIYHNILKDQFPQKMEISFYNDDSGHKQTLFYEKVEWVIDNEKKGLRYGENPCQEASFYKLTNGNIAIGDVKTIIPGKYIASDIELLQSGKHPGKINITDVDNGLNILRYFHDTPCCAVIKHNNPSGVAKGSTISDAFEKAFMADRIAAFGGAVVFNRPMDMDCAAFLSDNYVEVIAAPEYEEGVMEILEKKKNIRVMAIRNIEKLNTFIGERVVDFKSLIDGGIIAQLSYSPKTLKKEDLLPAETIYKDKKYKIDRMPIEKEYEDIIFGWLVESGVTSNSVIYVKNGITVGIGTGEQDRVGVAEIARDKAYRKSWDRISWEKYKTPWHLLNDNDKREEIISLVNAEKGGLKGSVMVSDAFFPFRDGIDVGLNEGVTAVVQPGGSLRDFEVIEACNEKGATMVYTGQRSFKH